MGREPLLRALRSSGDSAPPERASPPHQTRGHPCARHEGQRRPRSQPHRSSNRGKWRQDADPTTRVPHVRTHERRPKRAPPVRLENRDASGQTLRLQSMLAPPAPRARRVRRPWPSSAQPEGNGRYTQTAPTETRTARTPSRGSSAAYARAPHSEYTLDNHRHGAELTAALALTDSAATEPLGTGGVEPDVVKPIAAPIIGGIVTSTIHVLIITPVIFQS